MQGRYLTYNGYCLAIFLAYPSGGGGGEGRGGAGGGPRISMILTCLLLVCSFVLYVKFTKYGPIGKEYAKFFLVSQSVKIFHFNSNTGQFYHT